MFHARIPTERVKNRDHWFITVDWVLFSLEFLLHIGLTGLKSIQSKFSVTEYDQEMGAF